MALTISALKKDVAGNKRMHSGLITFDASYPAGGEALTPENLGLHTIDHIDVRTALGFSFDYDHATAKLKAYCPGVVVGAAGAVAVDDFPLSGVGASAISISLSAGATTQRFGGQVEVADTVDLSTVASRFIAIGT